MLDGAAARQNRFWNADKARHNGTDGERHQRNGHRPRRFVRAVPRSMAVATTPVIVVGGMRVSLPMRHLVVVLIGVAMGVGISWMRHAMSSRDLRRRRMRVRCVLP